MEIILSFFKYIIDLGVSVMMPIIITILGILFRKKISISFKAGLTVGLGFVGLGVITNLLLSTISPVTQALVDNLGFKLSAIDIGWAVGASIAWGTEVVPFVFIAVIATNVIMIALNWTKTMDVDIWNFWHPLFIASALYLTTGSMIIAVLSSIVNMAIVFKLADWTQKDCETVLGVEGISFPHIQTTAWAVIGYPLNWLIDKIPGVRNVNWTTESIQNRLGIFGEPMMMGLFIGGALAAAAKYPFSGILQTGVTVSAALVLIPRMIALLMDGLTVISEAAHEFMEKRFPGRDLYIGLDSAVAVGHPFVLSLGLLMIPVTLALAFILPGNKTLPLADMAALPFFMVFAIVPSKGNLFRGLISGIIFATIILYLSSMAAPLMTELAGVVGYEIPKGATQVTNLAIGAQWYTWVVYWIFEFIGNLF